MAEKFLSAFCPAENAIHDSVQELNLTCGSLKETTAETQLFWCYYQMKCVVSHCCLFELFYLVNTIHSLEYLAVLLLVEWLSFQTFDLS